VSGFSQPNLRSDVEVRRVRSVGDDDAVIQAAQVSVTGENDGDYEKAKGLINYLLREKHGSPFEHNSITFYVNAPIFVAREFMRHRIGWSYNELSLRYSEGKADFYVPNVSRPLVNAGSSSRPELVAGTTYQQAAVLKGHTRAAKVAWEEYQWMLGAGVAKEVARGVLPVSIYTEFYATANARSIMAFLSLRTTDERATHKSRPQLEIQWVADKIEDIFAEEFPLTYEAYNKNGRVAP
jgi:thymidylate synthase (FAD)